MNIFLPLLKRRLRQGASALLAVGLGALALPVAAQMKASEADLKAAIIINMAMFVDWPPHPTLANDRLSICVLGSSPVATALSNAQGKAVRNRTLQTSKVRPDGLAGCHVVYLSPDDRARLPEIVAAQQTAPVLIAGDSPDYFRRGVMLNLELSGGHIVFDIDLRTAQKTGLQISSKALRLARQIIE
ncbi:YfiR family protein [Propionivibrio limicola]|uniref:YfiR family protein n=1 Tax=Propionivibrio limicola TaxID=167645 RepID=UPI0012919537|nr:YfiR family protein [Propionivibrio limicola]